MRAAKLIFTNGRVFDGRRLLEGVSLVYEAGQPRIVATPAQDSDTRDRVVDLAGDIVSPGYVDLQVNGGGGVMLNDAPGIATLRRIAGAHRALGVAHFLPTLITASRDVTQAAIAAAAQAVQENLPGVAGLHLEGPHLASSRKGAHDARHIRPMTQDDLEILLAAAAALPVLKVTLAPEAARLEQVAALHAAGVRVSLGHTNADYDTCLAYFEAGARHVTHLFNAMSQLGSRAPGLVGAALESGAVSAGLISDGLHVHPASLRVAWAAKRPPGAIYLVSDAMAVAGTALTGFSLDGREVRREAGRLSLADGTLAGADLDLTRAIRTLVDSVGVPLEAALAAAVTVPASIIGRPVDGPGPLSDLIRIAADLSSVSWAATGLSDPAG